MTKEVKTTQIRALELFCGIGGFAAATRDQVSLATAVDINRNAIDVYRHNFSHPAVVATTESISNQRLAALKPDLWWMSPPCQPFTHRGNRRDIQDSRASGFLRLLESFAKIQPTHLALENVPGFSGSRAHQKLRTLLDELGYEVFETLLCPTQLGFPNRRKRFYLIASRESLQAAPVGPATWQPLSGFLDPNPSQELWVDPDLPARYPNALNIVDANDPAAVTACFTAAYGHSPVRSGSYLRTPNGLRRFAPSEILRLLGFPAEFAFPNHLPTNTAWRLAGNSLSLPAVLQALKTIPSMARPPTSHHVNAAASQVPDSPPPC